MSDKATPITHEERKRIFEAINRELDKCNRPDILRPAGDDPIKPWITCLADSIRAANDKFVRIAKWAAGRDCLCDKFGQCIPCQARGMELWK